MSNPELEQAKSQNAEHDIVMGEALERLEGNADFKTVIMNGYLEGKVLASVSLLAVPQIKAEGRRGDLMEDLVAASNLKYFLQMVRMSYSAAIDPVLSDEEEEEILAAQAEQGAH